MGGEEEGEIDMYYYDANSSSVVMVNHPMMMSG